ncbi:ribose 5-phosphate isomerase B [Alkalibacterium putridalgicola]|uniref:ribose 5-phosphate isomerase B n=1 Tax=Alkalibacterium putridalgicola TaxID=426703 RepID=UPI0034CDB50E
MNIVIGSDHGGKKLKDSIVEHLKNKSLNVNDIGPYTIDSVDFPSYAVEVGNRVAGNDADLGILCCGTGIGMSIAANKINGIRASVVSDCFSAEATRKHNNSNVLCLGERVVGESLALKIVDTWISTEFEGGRHGRRIEQISKIENDL